MINPIKTLETKKGFTLVEVLIALLIMAIVGAVTAPVITRKMKKPLPKTPHGRYECSRVGANFVERVYFENIQISSKVVSACNFKSVSENASYYIVQAVGGGGGGNSAANGLGGKAGNFDSIFLPSIEGTLSINLGNGGALNTKGGTTTVTTTDSEGNTSTILSAEGGNPGGLYDGSVPECTETPGGTEPDPDPEPEPTTDDPLVCKVNTTGTFYCNYNDYGPLYDFKMKNWCYTPSGGSETCMVPVATDHGIPTLHTYAHKVGSGTVVVSEVGESSTFASTYHFNGAFLEFGSVSSFFNPDSETIHGTITEVNAATNDYMGLVDTSGWADNPQTGGTWEYTPAPMTIKISLKIYPLFQLVESSKPLTCINTQTTTNPAYGYSGYSGKDAFFGQAMGASYREDGKFYVKNCSYSYTVTSLTKVTGYTNLFTTGQYGDVVMTGPVTKEGTGSGSGSGTETGTGETCTEPETPAPTPDGLGEPSPYDAYLGVSGIVSNTGYGAGGNGGLATGGATAGRVGAVIIVW